MKNSELDKILSDIATIITPKLLEYNGKIKMKVKEAITKL
jgi:hypothetical protein